MKISTRARVLLTLVGDCTLWEGDERPGKTLTRYFYPTPNRLGLYSPTLNEHIDVSSAGDAAALRGLESKGLIRRMKPTAVAGPDRYCYAITEDGICTLAQLAEVAK